MLTCTGPFVLTPTNAALEWARVAPVVKARNDPRPLRIARADAWKIWLHMPGQDSQSTARDVRQAVDDAIIPLGGLGKDDPRFLLVLCNEWSAQMPALRTLADWLAGCVTYATSKGYGVAGPAWSSGAFDAAEWDYLRSRGWLGLRAIILHGYWGLPYDHANPASALTPWNALRYQTYWQTGDPPVILGECGRDMVRDGPISVNDGYVGRKGWRNDGLNAEQYMAEVRAFDAALTRHAGTIGATYFAAGPTVDWMAYDMDPVAGRIIAETDDAALVVTPPTPTPAPTPVPQPTPAPGGPPMEFPFPTTLYKSPNHNDAPDTTRSLVVIHSTRSGRSKTSAGQPWTMEHEFDATVGFMLQPGTVSSDVVVSPARVGFMQPFGGSLIMWHAGSNNTRSRGYEICQARIDTPYTDMQLRKTAWLVRQDCIRHGIPMKRVMNETTSGIIGHQDSAQGKSSGKTDPGPLFNWTTFIKYVNDPSLFAVPPAEQYQILGFRAWLDAQPAGEYGAPRHDAREFGDGSGDLYLRLTPTPAHPDGPYLIYRKFLHTSTGDLMRAIRPVSWTA